MYVVKLFPGEYTNSDEKITQDKDLVIADPSDDWKHGIRQSMIQWLMRLTRNDIVFCP